MPAISDTSPIILYARINRLALFHQLFGNILLPPAVWREVVTDSQGRAGADLTRQLPWIHREPLPPRPFPSAITALDAGEAEAIQLALSFMPTGPIVILDDRPARRVASRLGLVITGSGGILTQAKQAGLISSVRPILNDLREAGLYLSDAAERRVLAVAGE